MLHTKFQDHRIFGSGKEVFTIQGRGGHLDHVTNHFYKFMPSLAKEAPYEIWV